MEPAGLVLGVVGLAGAFKSCIDLFSCFASHRSLGRDYEILDAKLQVEKVLLLQWAQRVRLLEENYDERLDDSVTSQAVSCILASIQHLLSESTALKERYGLQSTQRGQTTRLSIISNARMEKLARDFNVMKLRMSRRQENVSRSARLHWIIADKEKFNELIQELSHFVSRLNHVLQGPEPHQGRNLLKDMMREDFAAVRDFKMMHLIHEATSDRGDPVSEAAKERILEINQRAVLDLIWFRSMDDRKDGIDPPHTKTFEWALRPPHSEVEWDDLSQWLRSGSGMYSISGKAGSGKSTLMKYLSEHQMTADLLKEWAASSPLGICSFYFWNIGTREQRSQEGLPKAVLFKLLQAEPSLIPALLPRLWQEINENNGDRPDPPSKAELAATFGMISSGYNLQRKFCFFIDGLDEYVGNYLDSVVFVQRLYKNPHIKVIVSSRPIPICVDAFSSGPRLRLEDLTRGDISAYVQDTVGSHPYLEHLLESDHTLVDNLLRGLVEKASGVFLWVALACRSVLDGFAAYDRIDELQSRVDHLPPELEDLFQHMLDKVDHRYHEQMAKLLRICYMRQIDADHRRCESSVYTIALANFDSYGLNCEDSRPLRVFSASEERQLCAPMEGRLRSRCGGLLELRRETNFETSICFCTSADDHDILVHSVVRFMHRTVFEYLDQPHVWSLPAFRITDPSFNANSALSLMSLQLARLLFHNKESPQEFLIDAIQRAQLADSELPDSAFPILPKLKDISDLVTSRRPTNQGDISLLLAVESGMVNCTRYYLPQNRERPLEFPLLYHAFRKPLFWREHMVPSSPDMIRFLLSQGCKPNESFKNREHITTTSWRDWLRELYRMDKDSVLANMDVCEGFLRGGADVCPAGLEPLESILTAHFNKTNSSTAKDRLRYRKLERVVRLIEEKKELAKSQRLEFSSQANRVVSKKRREIDDETKEETETKEKKGTQLLFT